MEVTDEIKHLFTLFRAKIGAGIRKVEITDDALCAALELALQDYNEYVLDYIVKSNWSNIYGKSVTDTDLAYAFSTRTVDISRDISNYFSHDVGLQQEGTKWELKKDFFEIECGKQVYAIPAGRTINKVLYITPPTTDPAMFAQYGAVGTGFTAAGSFAQLGGVSGPMAGLGGGFGWWGGLIAMPLYDVMLTATDMKMKNQYLQCDLTYKVTAGPDGTHLIHLTNVPGGRFDRLGGFGRPPKCYCWYTYYDTNPGNEDECAEQNPSVFVSPDQVPINMHKYAYLNDAAKITVRHLFFANAYESYAFAIGKFNGDIQFISNPLKMNFQMYMEAGAKERESTLTLLKERLDFMTPYNMAEKEAKLVEDTRKALGGTPLKFLFR